MRIGGMASGMDTEQIVKDLMRVRRIPVDNMKQKKQVLEWQRDEFRQINTLFSKFRNNIFDGVLRKTKMTSKTVSSSNSQLVTATSLSGKENMSYTLSNVTKLATSARNSSEIKIVAGDTSRLDTSKSLWELSSTGGQLVDKSSDFNWKLGGVEKYTEKIANSTNEINLSKTNFIKNASDEIDVNYLKDNMMVKVNGKTFNIVTEGTPGTGEVLFDKDTGKLSFANNLAVGSQVTVDYFTDGKQEELEVTVGTKAFQLSGKGIADNSLTIMLEKSDGTVVTYTEADFVTSKDDLTASNVFVNKQTGEIEFKNSVTGKLTFDYKQNFITSSITTVNKEGETLKETFAFTGNMNINDVSNRISTSAVGVSSFYDEFTDKITMNRKETGNLNTAGSEMLFEGQFFTNILNMNNTRETGGENATFTINGLETQRQSNTFEINGMTITLKDTFTTGEVTLSSRTNTDEVFDTVMNFVNEYNELIEKVNGKLQEERFRDYKPLTDEQREALSEKEIEKWEERAKSGSISRDPMVSGILDRLRSAIYGQVNNLPANSSFKHISDLGINTSSNYMDRGKLEINEEKLRQAIERDAEGVYNIFAADGVNNNDKGIARRVREQLGASIEMIAGRAGGSNGKNQNNSFTIGRNLNNLETQISSFERRLEQIEDRYWRQFTGMEKAMQKMNDQAGMVMAQLFPQQK